LYFIGVDVGQLRDPTAIAIIERVDMLRKAETLPGAFEAEADRIISKYRLMYLEQPPLKTSYVSVVERVLTLLKHPSLLNRATLLVDATGVGGPVIDLMRDRGLVPIGITLTSGQNANENAHGYTVPKKDIVSILQVLLETERFEYTSKLRLSGEFEKQMEGFRVKLNQRGAASYGADTEGIHDDLVISVALPVWYAERVMGSDREIKHREAASVYRPFEHEIGGKKNG